MKYDLAVQNALILSSSDMTQATLAVKDGVVAAILSPDCCVDADETIDATACWLLPGLVDMHVHIRESLPGGSERIQAETRAAAAGGVTTVVVMPDSRPPVADAASLKERAELFREHSVVDFALTGGAGGESLRQIVDMADAGAVGFFGCLGAYRDSGSGLHCASTADIFQVMERTAQLGRFIGFHCEDPDIVSLFRSRAHEAELTGSSAHGQGRPEFAEVLSALTLLETAEVTGARLHLMHLSSPRAISMADLWREEGAPITVETAPHYLALAEEDAEDLSVPARTAPPLRTEESRGDLIELLQVGSIDVVASDHIPGSAGDDLGLPGLETALPVILDAAIAGELTAQEVVLLMSENPARVSGLYPGKGTLQPGADADFIIVDPSETTRVAPQDMYTEDPGGAEIYHGLELNGRIEHVFGRGQPLSRRGEVISDPGRARWMWLSDEG